MSNFPPGAANDSRAPYNQADTHKVHCTDCNGDGWVPVAEGDESEVQCETCNGTGYVPPDHEREYDKYDEYDHE